MKKSEEVHVPDNSTHRDALMPRVLVVAAALALVLATALAAGAPDAGAVPAQQCGGATASPSLWIDRTTIGVDETAVVNVRGTNYLVPPHVCGTDVFGGIYVFFGWVRPGGNWGPSWRSSDSSDGLFGTTFSYPGVGGGDETRDDGTGTVRLVSFTAGGESGLSTPFHMDGAGNWATDLVVRGATYSFTDVRTGQSNTVDCRVVQCGVFTIGAHGKASRTNERFVPINFVDRAGRTITPSAPTAAGAGGAVSSGGGAGGTPSPGSGATAGGNAEAGAAEGSAGPVAGSVGGTAQVGEAPTTTEVAPDASVAAAVVESDRAERAASVQEFGSDGGGGALIPVLTVAAVVLAAAVAVVAVRRRRARQQVTTQEVAE